MGIISHVEGIKQRIKTQIELVKQPNGMSRVVLQKEMSDTGDLEGSVAQADGWMPNNAHEIKSTTMKLEVGL